MTESYEEDMVDENEYWERMDETNQAIIQQLITKHEDRFKKEPLSLFMPFALMITCPEKKFNSFRMLIFNHLKEEDKSLVSEYLAVVEETFDDSKER